MASDSVDPPRISPAVLRFFASYSSRYLRRNTHSIRLARRCAASATGGRPLIVCANHPSWWDPLVCLFLSRAVFPQRAHYAPIESAALQKYSIFERIGFFGIKPGTVEGAGRFLKVGRAVLSDSGSALWVTAQGDFKDPRVRPVRLRQGVGHLVSGLSGVAVLPLAIEYPFWTEKCPEVLARFGEPLIVHDGGERSPREWTSLIARKLEEAQDALAIDSIARRAEAFELVSRGNAGVGGIYDVWRWIRARARGERFHRSHGGDL